MPLRARPPAIHQTAVAVYVVILVIQKKKKKFNAIKLLIWTLFGVFQAKSVDACMLLLAMDGIVSDGGGGCHFVVLLSRRVRRL